ncbi:binding-protein-dependent transport systems inner membrane component [Thermaerobacter marianensis DSM 12885]|uniref:Binding-protein-dependent transport systems inner membrane component n=1 Tax=Thermaerobacter marianensis (strain ATCC 700841 / DSM 12885 / JCM 10246 / 7p75a) TaxID=644966 RepID=E6SI20_THEM7|nr:ABC transporter permease [Thermaerobacter marianensis]ADU51900.1 binding-protein-dependent transport systems inner membrane component [Thermaerobacter marianensis DSM 12885]
MKRYIIKRLFAAVITLLGVTFAVFLTVRLIPGDPAVVIAGPMASAQEVERIRTQLGLDRPFLEQYGTYLSRLVRGDLGVSARTQQPVLREILARLPYTLELALVSGALATVTGVAAGVIAATRRYTLFDYLASFGTLLGVSMPVYWLGLLLIVLFAVRLQWLPAAGAEGLGSIVLPALTLTAYTVALVARMTRATMFEVLEQDYVRTAWAKGLPRRRIIYRHALRNALVPIITVVALQFGALLGGAVLTESVFAWPGIGLLLVDSIFARDFPMVQGIVLVYSTMIILLNLGVDLLYAYIDPRIRYS